MNRYALALLALSSLVDTAPAQAIIAQNSGLANPDQVIDFSSNAYPNFTPITTQFAGITVSHARYVTTTTSNNLVGGFLTNDFSGAPQTLTITFAAPITDLSFVYHQIGTTGATTMRAMLFGAVVDSFTGVFTATQPNNYFGFTNTAFDELQIDFDSDFNLDTLAFSPSFGLADCIVNNGSGINAPDFSCQTLPVVGTTWVGQIALDPSTITTGIMYAPGGLLAVPAPLFGGELLIETTPAPSLFMGAGTFMIPIPAGPGWIGAEFTFQGMRVDVPGGALRIRPLNALTLRLGI